MKINWKVRLQHPAFYFALAGLIGLILTDAGVVPAGKYEVYVQLLFGLLTAAGVIIDPTTEGIGDSVDALQYEKPREDVDY
ncbi:phage holin [Planomicrobium sp. CPCC 101079]|uniref:phage holin n=1 Tax=Planomicrobium sp. CPCC 101079 TaxID=2599618 RepID=UPI0011B3859E|nr:phage holin [Planomicrobium sp. CPCC 101079]TWT04587.1 phage holin [Planomicrobium sp. CPCC 101079]